MAVPTYIAHAFALLLSILLTVNVNCVFGNEEASKNNDATGGKSPRSNYVTRGDDMVFHRSSVERGEEIFQHPPTRNHDKRHLIPSSLSSSDRELELSSSSSSSRDGFWDVWRQFDNWKTETSMWDTSTNRNGRPTLRKFHYVIIPIWWSGEPRNSRTAISKSQIRGTMSHVRQIYLDMSWGTNDLTFEVWDQVVLAGVTAANSDFDNSEKAGRDLVKNAGKVQFRDYTGIMLVYNTASFTKSPFAGGGGWGGVNSDFLWSSYDTAYDVLRHEIGHNYGHPHHLSNQYLWRVTRGQKEFVNGKEYYDGWDMMSGGNGFAKSDLAAASKWFFNWITNDAVQMMQPEGPTVKCPNCLSEAKGLVLKPFDDVNVQPSSSNKMAVHIPIIGTSGNRAYSYWLSYRGTANDGLAAKGLSVHVSWFSLGGIFGASYDSLNYDANGGTLTTNDSFILPGTCYVVAPPLVIMDIDEYAGKQVQPIICVDSLDRGKSITISVSFMNPESPPSPTVSLESNRKMQCSENGVNSPEIVANVSNNRNHLLHYIGTGKKGKIDAQFCLQASSSSARAVAYFYDSYPYSHVALQAPAGYGAYKKVKIAPNGNACSGGSSDGMSSGYISEYSETYVLITTDQTVSGSANLHYSSNCVVTVPTPSTDASIESAAAWRLWTPASWTVEGWLWDVELIEFYSSNDCSAGSIVDTSSGTAIDSGNAGGGYQPGSAFSPSGVWGGRSDSNNEFFIGMMFKADVTVRCIKLNQRWNGALQLYVQAKKGTKWVDVWHAPNLAEQNKIKTSTAPSWRLWTPGSSTEKGWVWDVERIQLYSSTDCSTSSLIDTSSGTAIDSGNAGEGYKGANAFSPSGVWGGRSDSLGDFWVGMSFNSPVTVRCVKMAQPAGNGARELHVQARQDGSGWSDVWHAKPLVAGTNVIEFSTDPSPAPIIPPKYFVEVKYDKYPKQTSWWIRDVLAGKNVIKYKRGKIKKRHYRLRKQIVLKPGRKYALALRDSKGNGLCCRTGKGYAKVYAIKGGGTIKVIKRVKVNFGKKKNVTFIVPNL